MIKGNRCSTHVFTSQVGSGKKLRSWTSELETRTQVLPVHHHFLRPKGINRRLGWTHRWEMLRYQALLYRTWVSHTETWPTATASPCCLLLYSDFTFDSHLFFYYSSKHLKISRNQVSALIYIYWASVYTVVVFHFTFNFSR